MCQVENRWNELADIKDELAARDWFRGTSGNLSIKVSDSPLQFLVTASGKDKRKRTKEDFILVDRQGQPIEETLLKPSAETIIHQAIYSKTDAGCCLHVHTVENNVISELFAGEGEVTFQGLELVKAFGLWGQNDKVTVPIIDNSADLSLLADDVMHVLKNDTKAILMRNHGITVWGRNGFEAKKYLEAFEFLFEYHLKLRSFQAIVS
ncbi:methylthioribulose 1-phosphate dehydratase [Guptibacillus hwajinpoensis]|uniref:methylthioribulose 1-phosphate dehydratase n=1 Tax=Guptibacillus hwajinpoensis TaxID=208199 RepID=UPI001CFE577E|nr:methylthioribulose 1-phosphate dehydratase [Pseudalkalibacillus hwajinpoensis]WLR58630.1 methylthioribulose 1-phosphate dehydratase [Pseudalkalibacillus hwajinpoensis]